jgi:hypothetical protein
MSARSLVSFEIPPEGRAELAAIAELSSRLKDIQAAAREAGTNGITAASKFIAKKLALDEGQVQRLIDGLLSIRTLMRQTRLPPEELLAALTISLEQAPDEWKRQYLAQWSESRAVLLDYLCHDDWIAIRSKVRELTFLHENIFSSCRLLTELRPVYNHSGDEIVDTVLTTSLLIRYRSDVGRQREIQFALDVADLSEIRRQCERAGRKIAVAEQMFKQVDWPLTIAGKPTSEDEE